MFLSFCFISLTCPGQAYKCNPRISAKADLVSREGRVRSRWLDRLASFFFGVFTDPDEVKVHKHTGKERGQYPAFLTELAPSCPLG